MQKEKKREGEKKEGQDVSQQIKPSGGGFLSIFYDKFSVLFAASQKYSQNCIGFFISKESLAKV